MATPVLIDTDMGIDDAVALTLTVCCDALNLEGVVSVGGNVPLEQATQNIGRLLHALQPVHRPLIGRGCDQQRDGLENACFVHGACGLGEVELPVPPDFQANEYRTVYERLIERFGKELVIIAIGPLTNLAALLEEKPGLLEKAGRIIVMGGAVWHQGNVTPHAEFNFHRDPQAAARLLGAGLDVTVVSLDVTTQVAMDESHVAHLSRSNTRSGELLARMIRFPLAQDLEVEKGKFLVHDALAVGVLLWPQLFIRSRMGLEITTAGKEIGRSKPKLIKDKSRQVSVVVSVNVLDFLENMLEQLCQEHFVV